jgi:hypothetical protein
MVAIGRSLMVESIKIGSPSSPHSCGPALTPANFSHFILSVVAFRNTIQSWSSRLLNRPDQDMDFFVNDEDLFHSCVEVEL